MKHRMVAIGVAAAVTLAGVTATACVPLKPAGAECSGLIYRHCTITDGHYAGISTAMTYEQAFETVCRNVRVRRFEPDPIIYSKGGVPFFYGGDFCDQPLSLLRYDYWGIAQPGLLRDVGVSLFFEDGTIVQINVGYRGWDP